MNKTQKLKQIILSKYGSINEFSKIAEIPPTTLRSALEKDIGGMAVDRVIKICDILNIDVKTFEPVNNIKSLDNGESLLLKNFYKLNDLGKSESIKRVEELTHISKYTQPSLEVENLSYLDPIAAHDDNLNDKEKELMNKIIQNKIKLK
ncbi:XRE family transcriptional regulator [Clostridium perfringens]|nr:XRE family transcriptional regulator [Clostridium perfringens]